MSARRSPSTCTLGSQLVAISTVCSLIAPMLRTVSTPRPDITISMKVMTAAILIRMESFDMKMMSWLKIPGNVHAGRNRFGATRLSRAMPWGCAYDLRIEHPSELPVNEARVLLLTRASERGSTTPVGAFRAPAAVASCGYRCVCLSQAAMPSTFQAARTESRNLPTSSLRRFDSLDRVCALSDFGARTGGMARTKRLIERLAQHPDAEHRLPGFIEQFHLPFPVRLEAAGDAADKVGTNGRHLAPRGFARVEFVRQIGGAGIWPVADPEKIRRHS